MITASSPQSLFIIIGGSNRRACVPLSLSLSLQAGLNHRDREIYNHPSAWYNMDAVPAMLAAVLVIATLIPYGVALPSTAPAFLWSPHQDESKEAVNYQTLSGQDLAKSVLSEGAWSNILCRRKKLEPSVDLALVFVGTELQSGDISGIKQADPALINLLKVFYMNSNFSMAFPYVAASGEKETMESSLMSGIMEACENDLDVSNVALLESCSVENDNFKKLADLSSVNDYLESRVEKSPKGKPDLLVICHGSSQSSGELGNRQPESEIFSQLMSSVEHSQRKYAVLYVSNPYRPSQYSSYPGIQRFLAEGTFGNESGKPTICDEVCQIKSSLLEGLLVAIVLLIILISGLCCMAGIDTPTRFEAPQES